ncbi:copper chaperone PCu(A)C [Pseudomonas cichorii]|uniref:copper chaperone PCu(A)C n=1 Tax=Pseudomonas cichorii TaxID=36746 RepID=UPI001C8A0617|nr:copper chaperone PCu(A)C [Pseudomonas cichorii]MBX8516722.1 copper chaperone PCu(A)C [Pseudomonas cichorii]MBX8531586.1 copper chaperone PCu(A)C [Pseudomonas cichorii]MBX8576439.1 copper chaperone PCu(A)C [Pseudomonas cichorii]
MLKKALMLAALLLPACFANAHEYTGGKLLIGHPWSMELPPNAPTVAAYFTIENKGNSADRLLSVKTPIAGEAQLHEHVQADGLMKMRQVPSVDVPAGAKVSFAPMAYHVMLLGIKDRSMLALGQRFPMTLHFEKAGDIDVQVVVQKQEPEHKH